MGAIFKKEIYSYFTSGIAYVVLGITAFFAGIFFMYGSLYSDTTDMTGVFSSMFMVIVLVAPILTMKLFSEEKRQKTEQALLTAPVKLYDIVMGKFLSAVVVYAVSLCVFFLEAIVLSVFAAVAWSTFISNFIGIFLLGCAFIAIGLFISSVTESQVVAAVIGIASGILISLIDALASTVDSVPFLSNILSAASFTVPYQDFTAGIVSLSNVMFFLSVCTIFLFLTGRMLEKKRWS